MEAHAPVTPPVQRARVVVIPVVFTAGEFALAGHAQGENLAGRDQFVGQVQGHVGHRFRGRFGRDTLWYRDLNLRKLRSRWRVEKFSNQVVCEIRHTSPPAGSGRLDRCPAQEL